MAITPHHQKVSAAPGTSTLAPLPPPVENVGVTRRILTKACPYCGETIHKAAKECKHCGEFLDGLANLAIQKPGIQEPKASKGSFLTKPLFGSKRPRTTGRFTHIICPNPKCEYQGPAKRTPKGSTGLGCLLTLLWLLPGILYFIFKSGYRYTCPQCGIQVGES